MILPGRLCFAFSAVLIISHLFFTPNSAQLREQKVWFVAFLGVFQQIKLLRLLLKREALGGQETVMTEKQA